MRNFDLDHLEGKAEELCEDIERRFAQYRVNIAIKSWIVKSDRIIYQVKLKRETREAHIFARAPDVQLRLKLPLFQPFKHNFTIYIAVSDREIVYDRLPKILRSSTYTEVRKKMLLPYIVGHSIMGDLVMVDLASFPHLLIGGSTNSGKTVGSKVLVCSIIAAKSPNMVNFILIDVGATDLMPFDGIPHLSCPVIREAGAALRALTMLRTEADRRIDLQITNDTEYKLLPRIVVVIDEFPALISGIGNKEALNLLTETISILLQRGRHAKIHVVLASQNPTLQNMRVDLGNITARIAFTCAKPNFSMTILGEGGAEKLSGKGDMYLKSPQHDGLQRIQGVFIAPMELNRVIDNIKRYPSSNRKFMISEADLQVSMEDQGYRAPNLPVASKWTVDNRLFAQIIVWALARESISCNMIMDTFGLGWKRANGFLDRLHSLGIAGDMYAKLPRAVLPACIEDLHIDTVDLLKCQGYTEEQIRAALGSKQ